MNKKILFLSLLSLAVIPSFAGAVTIQSIVDAAEQTTLYIASGIVVILWVVTGVLFLTASGDPGKLTTARKALFASVAGTIMIIVAASAISIISSAFGLNGTSNNYNGQYNQYNGQYQQQQGGGGWGSLFSW